MTLDEAVTGKPFKSHEKETKGLYLTYLAKLTEQTLTFCGYPEAKKPSEEMLNEICFEFISTFELESMEDFAYFFKLVRKGEYQIIKFERFGLDVMQDSFRQYLYEKKLPRVEQIRKTYSNHKKKELEGIKLLNHDKAKELRLKLEAQLNEKTLDKHTPKEKGYTMADELKELAEILPRLDMKSLEKLQAQYNNAYISHLLDESRAKPKPIQMIEDEIERRGR